MTLSAVRSDPNPSTREGLEAENARLRTRLAAVSASRRHGAILDSATSFAIIATDREGRVTDWNAGAERILGWSADEMRGDTVARFFTPEDRVAGRPEIEMQLALEHGRADDERWHMRRDGSKLWASGEMMPLRDDDGGHIGYIKILRDRTQEHRAGLALRETEERLLRSQEAGGIGSFSVGIDDGVLSPTPELCRIYGLPVRQDHPSAAFEGLVLSEDAHLVSTAESRRAGEPPRDVEYRIRRPDTGEVRWIARQGEIERDDAGRPVRFFGVARDVTEQRNARDALRESEERYHSLFDTIDQGFCVIRFFDGPHGPFGDYVHVEANAAFEHHLGIPHVAGQTLRDIAPDEETGGWLELYGDVLRTGRPIRFDRLFVPTGRHLELAAHRVEPASRREVAVLFTDITARKRAEAALRASEAVARENVERVQLALAAGAIIGTWHWDIPGDRFTVDEAFASAFGLDPALGREGIPLARIVDTVHPDDQAGLADAIGTAVTRGGAYAHQYRVRRADGRYYWIEANGRVEHGPDATPRSFPGVLLDIDQRRAVEAERDRAIADLRGLNDTLESRVAERTDELLQAEEALRQSQKMEAVGQLTGGVAHDFNNLLTIIRSSVDFLRRPDLPDARKGRYLDAVSETVDRAAKLTGQLLAFARRQALTPEVFDVAARLRGIGDMLDTVTGARVTVRVQVPDVPCFVRADVSQFETALVNMAVNARDAMDGEGTLTLRVDCGAPMPQVRGHAGSQSEFAAISVMDTGSGIAPDQLGKIFEPFFTTKEVGKGTGLGLSQVFGFAKQSGGDVDVVSALGEGTTFTLYLPEVAVHAGGATVEEPVPAPAPVGAGQRVLVVEDNIEVGRFCTQILEDLGYGTEWAANAEDALARLGADGDGFDVVFSDVVMPGMGGVALAGALRERLPGLPVVLASGYSHVLAQEDDHGFELLHKPYSAEQLARVLQRVIGRSAAS